MRVRWGVVAIVGGFGPAAWAAPVLHAPTLYAGVDATIVVDGATPGARVALVQSTAGRGNGPCAGPSGPCVGVRRPSLVSVVVADAGGVARHTLALDRGDVGTIWFQAAEVDGVAVLSDVVARTLVPWDTDSDGDGAVDAVEIRRGLDPSHPDTDGDGQPDGVDPLPLVPNPVDAFVVDDVVVTSPGAEVRDPEFDPVGGRIVWQERDGAAVYVARVRGSDGAIVPADGRGAVVATDVAPMQVAKNGPEWVQTAAGAQALFLRSVQGQWVIHRSVEQGGVWTTSPLPGWPLGTLVSGSDDVGDPFPRITWARQVGVARHRGLRGLDQQASEIDLGERWTVLRWVKGQATAVGLRLLGDDVEVHLVDGATGADTRVPVTGPVPWDVWAGPSAAWGGDLLLLLARGPRAAPDELAVWRQHAGVWTLDKVILPPAGLPFVVSPEPFEVDGVTYASFLATTVPQAEGSGPGEVWVAALDVPTPRLRRVSLTTEAVRKDPEPYTAGSAPWVYYTALTTQGPEIRRCATGL